MRRHRRLVITLVAAGLGLVALAAMILAADRPERAMDPGGLGPGGARALVEVLGAHGVTMTTALSVEELTMAVQRPAGPAGRTLLIADPTYLSAAAAQTVRELRTVDRLVLLSPDQDDLTALGLAVSAWPGTASDLHAQCSSPLVRTGDVLADSDRRYELGDGAAGTVCFPLNGPDESASGEHGSALVTVPATAGRPEVVILGSGRAWTNRGITEDAHAGLALRALGAHGDLVWYLPGPADLISGGGTATDVWPRALAPVSLVLAVATICWAVIAGRRLGPLVPEPLPVVVRASETTRSRGQLYRRSRDRAHVARVLRSASVGRMRRNLRLPPTGADDTMITEVAARSGLTTDEVAALVGGSAPADDRALVALANALTDLEERTLPR